MQKNILFGIIGLLVGGVIGFYSANSLNRQEFKTANIDLSAPTAGQAAPTTVNTGGMQADVSVVLEAADSQPQSFAIPEWAEGLSVLISAQGGTDAEILGPNEGYMLG